VRQALHLARHLRLLAWLWVFGLPLASPGMVPPALQLGLKGGWTDNLLGDSLGQQDGSLALTLRLNQPLTRRLALEAGGSLTRFGDHDELDESNHSLALQTGGSTPAFENLWAQAGWFRQSYQGDYNLYDRDRLSLGLGLRRHQGQALRLRSQLQLSATAFPSYPDSLEADYRDAALSLGANLSLAWPLSLDLETGLQVRRYPELEPLVDTPWLWSTLRVSRPLGNRLGLRLQASRRWQLTADGNDLATLSANGLDPGELLWDGWRAELGLQHAGRRWRSSVSVDWLSADYAAEAGSAARQDEGLGVLLGSSRAWTLAHGWQLLLSLEGSQRRTRSTLSFYDTTTNSLRAGLALQSP
jgi:hypothetical protein